MKKKTFTKRILAVALSLFLVLGLMPMTAFANGTYTFPSKSQSGNNNSTLRYYLTDENAGTVTITEERGYVHLLIVLDDGWYFDHWDTYFTGYEDVAVLSDPEVKGSNPVNDDGRYTFYNQMGYTEPFGNSSGWSEIYIDISKGTGFYGDHRVTAVLKPILTVNAGEGVTYQVSTNSPSYTNLKENQVAVTYNDNATVTYTVADGYIVTSVSANYGTNYSDSGSVVTVSSIVKPATIDIQSRLKQQNVSFDANGGKGAMATQTFEHSVAQALTANSFTKDDYTFAGWNTEADGTGTAYADKQSVTFTPANDGNGITLYAQWTECSHALIYSASANRIVETCTAGCGHTATATLTASDQTYTGSPITTGASIAYSEGWVGDQPQPADSDYSNNINAGTAVVTTTVEGEALTTAFTINAANIKAATVTLDPTSSTYDGSEQKPAVTVTWNGITLVENTDYIIFYVDNVYPSSVNVFGTVYIDGINNFADRKEEIFEITNAQLTEVKVKQQGTLTYNGQEQTPAVTANAKTVDGCPVTFTYSTSPYDTYGTMPGFTNAGTYTVYFKASALNHNDYCGSFDVTVEKKAVTVTANDASKTYGDSDPALTYTHTELAGQDTLDITVSRASGENANTYTITASQTEGANPNYEITFKNGTFTIHKAALAVTVEDKTATYGDAVPNYTVKYEGFKNGDDKDDLGGTLAFECGYAQFSDKGEYTVKASGYTSGNYTISYVDGKLTVNAKPITVTIQNATSVYGNTLAELKATDNGIVNGDTNVYSLTTTTTGTSNVGKYAITGTALDDNYDVTFVNGEYEITKREITITVDAKNTVVNTTLPTYTYKVEGLVGVDALVTEPTLTCNANIAIIGEYDITASGADAGDNYSIKYVPAKLTVLTDNAIDVAAGYTEELKDYDPATVTSEDKAELNKPADTNAPTTGDNNNMFLWIALLFISGGAVITLIVVDRKRRSAAK